MTGFFTRLVTWVARSTSNPRTFAIALLVVLVWAASGPMFQYSDTWQLLINTGTTVVTFLMVFLLQAASDRAEQQQARDTAAILAMVAEIVRAIDKADDAVIPDERDQVRLGEGDIA